MLIIYRHYSPTAYHWQAAWLSQVNMQVAFHRDLYVLPHRKLQLSKKDRDNLLCQVLSSTRDPRPVEDLDSKVKHNKVVDVKDLGGLSRSKLGDVSVEDNVLQGAHVLNSNDGASKAESLLGGGHWGSGGGVEIHHAHHHVHADEDIHGTALVHCILGKPVNWLVFVPDGKVVEVDGIVHPVEHGKCSPELEVSHVILGGLDSLEVTVEHDVCIGCDVPVSTE